MHRRVAENQSVEHTCTSWNVTLNSDSKRGHHIPVADLKTVEGKHSAGVNMSNDGAVIQGDIAAQLDEIGFGHKHCTPIRS
jgi:hypothetical protein